MALLGTRAEAAAGERAAQRALEEATPLAKNGYKTVLLKSLLRRAVESLAPSPP